MCTQLQSIEDNDYRSWEEFEAAEIADPLDHFGGFTLDIGDNESAGSELFQVAVPTSAALQRAKQSASRWPKASAKFREVVVPEFQAGLVKRPLEALVAGLPAGTGTTSASRCGSRCSRSMSSPFAGGEIRNFPRP